LHDTVRFLGHVDHASIGYLYQTADALVMPTNYDYRSLAVQEAMRFGLAVIDSTADGNTVDLIRHGATGLVIDPDDVESLISCMRIVLTDPARASRLGQRAQAEVAAFTVSNGARQLASAVEARWGVAMSTRARPNCQSSLF
jgi:glycosyltransferase involved in cell wall biosynthesis